MANKSYLTDNFSRVINPTKDNLPELSYGLDSARVYNFEVHFHGVPGYDAPINQANAATAGSAGGRESSKVKKYLTLAAKRVASAGHTVEDIAVRRLNDLMYYPGAVSTDELTVTFDHLNNHPSTEGLFKWFRAASYDPLTGISAGYKSARVEVVQFTADRRVRSINTYYGVYPKSFKPAELNYNTNNEFHTYEVVLRYDFMDHTGSSSAGGLVNRFLAAGNAFLAGG